MQILTDRAEVAEVLSRFAASFDEKNWNAMRQCLDNAVHCDFSSLRGITSGTVTREDYVAQRIVAFDHLMMQHDLTNLRIRIDGESAAVQCNFVIRRFNSSPDLG